VGVSWETADGKRQKGNFQEETFGKVSETKGTELVVLRSNHFNTLKANSCCFGSNGTELMIGLSNYLNHTLQ